MPSDPYLRRVVIPGIVAVLVTLLFAVGAMVFGARGDPTLPVLLTFFATAFIVQAVLED